MNKMGPVSHRSSDLPELPDLGPPPKSSVDWFFTRRPGRRLDDANVRLVEHDPADDRQARGRRGVIAGLFSLLFRS